MRLSIGQYELKCAIYNLAYNYINSYHIKRQGMIIFLSWLRYETSAVYKTKVSMPFFTVFRHSSSPLLIAVSMIELLIFLSFPSYPARSVAHHIKLTSLN